MSKHLNGITHEITHNVGPNNTARKVVTTWVETATEAEAIEDGRKFAGADFTRVFPSGRGSFRVVAHFPVANA